MRSNTFKISHPSSKVSRDDTGHLVPASSLLRRFFCCNPLLEILNHVGYLRKVRARQVTAADFIRLCALKDGHFCRIVRFKSRSIHLQSRFRSCRCSISHNCHQISMPRLNRRLGCGFVTGSSNSPSRLASMRSRFGFIISIAAQL